MPVAVIADAHLGGPGGPAEPLVRQLDQLPATGCERLVVLGDLFDVWIGSRRFETPEIRSVVEALDRLRRRGIPIHYIEGNRDFYIAGSSYGHLFESVSPELVFEAGGKRFLAVHGDGLNKSDYLYRLFRAVSKNPMTRAGMLHLPGPLARPMVRWSERQISRTNFKHKKFIPKDVILDYAGRRLGGDIDVLLLGHFHEPHNWALPVGEVRILDAWFRAKQIEWLVDG